MANVARGFERALHVWITAYLARRHRRYAHEKLPQLFTLSGDFIGRELMIEGLYERAELEWLRTNVLAKSGEEPFDTILDVGANIGNHSLFFSDYCNRVLAFEPNPVTAQILRANVELNQRLNVKIFECGLGQEAGIAIPAGDASGNLGGCRYVFANSHEPRERGVEVRVGDQIVAGEQGVRRVDLIKVDVEGAELPVLAGLTQVLHRDHPVVVFEANAGSDNMGVVELLKSCGYSTFWFLDGRESYSKLRLYRWWQKLCDNGRTQAFAYDANTETDRPMCLALMSDHAARIGLGGRN